MIFSENRFPLFGIMLLEDFPFALTLFGIAGSSRIAANLSEVIALSVVIVRLRVRPAAGPKVNSDGRPSNHRTRSFRIIPHSLAGLRLLDAPLEAGHDNGEISG
jgi:hypothetical protein